MNGKIDHPISTLPIGLAMALGDNIPAMNVFSGMTPAGQQEIICRARAVRSQDEMRALVAGLVR